MCSVISRGNFIFTCLRIRYVIWYPAMLSMLPSSPIQQCARFLPSCAVLFDQIQATHLHKHHVTRHIIYISLSHHFLVSAAFRIIAHNLIARIKTPSRLDFSRIPDSTEHNSRNTATQTFSFPKTLDEISPPHP